MAIARKDTGGESSVVDGSRSEGSPADSSRADSSRVDASHTQRQRIAILGAGPAGLAAAFALSETPEYRARFEVVIYQAGWRAGGKCASGRDVGTAGKPGTFRVEQNGAHYLFGCYDQSFALVRQCFSRLAGDTSFGELSSEFLPVHHLVWVQETSGASWRRHHVFLPANLSRPGEGGDWCEPFDYCLMGWQLCLQGALAWLDTPMRFRSAEIVRSLFPFQPFGESARARVLRAVLQPLRHLVNAVTRLSLGAVRGGSRLTPESTRRGLRRLVVKLARSFGLLAARLRRGTGGVEASSPLAAALIALEIGAIGLGGIIEDRLDEPGGFERIDGEEYRDWLRRHGASAAVLESGLVKMWYDAVISYADGDPARPACAAGVSVRAILHALLGYKGAFAFHMRAEVGDSFIAPIVAALERQGVRIEYFQRVRDLIPASAGAQPRISHIEIEPQADPERAGAVMATLPGSSRRVWPNRPLDSELAACVPPLDSFYAPDSGRRRALEAGRDFSAAVLALPLGTLPSVCRRVLAERAEWREMVAHLGSAESLSLRLWLNRPISDLGWQTPPAVLSGFAAPLSTWEDSRATMATENGAWPQAVRASASLFGPLALLSASSAPSPEELGYRDRQALAARTSIDTFVRERVGALWPGARDDQGALDYALLVAPPELEGPVRLDAQYCSVNVGPCERYVIALPDTLQYRLAASESGYENLFLAGEWTRNGVEVGCIEGAVASGLQAARALAAALLPQR